MDSGEISPELEARLVERAVDGDEIAMCELREQHHAALKGRLLRRGALEGEAEDVMAELWSDCFAVGKLRRWQPQAGCTLKSWLTRVANNKFLTLLRHRNARPEGTAGPLSTDGGKSEPRAGEATDAGRLSRDDALCRLLRDALTQALATCDQRALLMLKLLYVHDLSQRELARMWGWHESKLSRTLSGVEDEIRTMTLDEVSRREPLLRLTWTDFLELCDDYRGSIFGVD